MSKRVHFIIALWLGASLISACGPSDTSLPTLRPTANSNTATEPTVDPNLGSGFDPNLGNDANNPTAQPTPTRESGANVGGSTDIESGASGSGFIAQLGGNASITSIDDGGQYFCNLSGHQIMSGTVAAPNVSFVLPVASDSGTYPLKGTNDSSGANDVTVQVALASADDVYDRTVSGTLIIDNLPVEDGDFVIGSFDFTIGNNTNKQISLSGTFNFESNNTTYCTG